ncbi:MAG: ribosome biogenesis GTP-binding protein YihA/YsxC [Rickettsiales bacterium]|jgi:GTP-binding protein|nr:ribosome biogenesis GTP-binding protein YihA/YsxC [Rickettsiales bacterium]
MKADLFQRECIFFYSVNEKGKYPKSNLPEIAFLGRSNVGKSSLINSLVNRKNLVRTSNSPGSTIKINYFKLGDKLMLVDLPGHGYAKRAKHVVENLSDLIEDYLLRKENLKKLVFIIDSRRGIDREDEMLLNFFKNIGTSMLLVFNKIDKLKKLELQDLNDSVDRMINNFDFIEGAMFTSCLKGFGIKKLKEKIIQNI